MKTNYSRRRAFHGAAAQASRAEIEIEESESGVRSYDARLNNVEAIGQFLARFSNPPAVTLVIVGALFSYP